LLLFLIRIPLNAQFDSSYYMSYPHRITGRAYLSNKYTTLSFQNGQYKLRYQPNTSINIGIGATYKWATLNLGIGFLNRDVSKGRTRYLDLQFHNYGRKFTLDLLGEFYHGFYLYPGGKGSPDGSFYRRPDLHADEIGANFQYVVNHRHFSYRSSFLQNEWQKKSAGSLLIGLEVYSGRVTADSTLVPTLVNKEGASENIRVVRFFEIGPNAGYVYTFVIKRHYFLTGSAVISLDYGANSIQNIAGETMIHGYIVNKTFKFCAGYNSSRYALSLLYTNNGIQGTSNNAIHQLTLNTGNFRVIFVHRFNPTKEEKKVLKKLP
jgi:hypothetical protein